jgi:hypothetical protein
METMVEVEQSEEFELYEGPEETECFDVGEARLPSSVQLVELEKLFGPSLADPEEVKAKVRELFVPLALLAYKDNLGSSNEKIRQDAANKIMEIADITGKSGGGGGGGNTVNLNLGGTAKTNLFSALGEMARGEIITAEVVE